MTYSRSTVKLNRLNGTAVWGTAVWGDMRWGQKDDQRTRIPVNTATINGGYTVEQNGALSIDPWTGTATLHVPGTAITAPIGVLSYGDRVEMVNEDTIVFQGFVSDVALDQEREEQRFGEPYGLSWTFLLRSTLGQLLGRTVTAGVLPAELLTTRIRRWLDLDLSELSSEQLTYVATFTADEITEPTSLALLDIARSFTTATGIPLRTPVEFPPRADLLVADPDAISWLGVAPDAVLGDAPSWAHGIHWDSNHGYLSPSGVDVAKGNTTFLSGYSTSARDPMVWGTSRWGSSRWGSGPVPVGLRPGQAVSILEDDGGALRIVSRVTLNFGATEFTSAIELTPPNDLPV